jgi:hypothetical protein
MIYFTFYLSEEEIKKVFEAIQKGNLNIAICSSKQPMGSIISDEYGK